MIFFTDVLNERENETEDAQKSFSDTEDSSVHSYEDERRNKKRKKRKRISYIHTVGEVLIPKRTIDNLSKNEQTDKLKKIFRKTLKKNFHWECLLAFTNVKMNKSSFTSYAQCMSPEHNIRFKFKAEKTESSYLELVITSNSTFEFTHKNTNFSHDDSEHSDQSVGTEKNIEAGKDSHDVTADINDPGSINKMPEKVDQFLDDEQSNDEELSGIYTKRKLNDATNQSPKLSMDISHMAQKVLRSLNENDRYIRKFGVPYSAYMYTLEQILFVLESQKEQGIEYVIAHFDGTGTVVAKPCNLKSKRVMYYVITIRNRRFILPIAEFITTDQTKDAFTTFLHQYRIFIEKNDLQWPICRAIVTDWSWALINAVLDAWDDITITQYLDEMFDVLMKKQMIRTNLCVLLTCCAHFLKRVAKHLDDNYNMSEEMRTFIMNCVSMMVLSRSIEEVDDIFTIFMRILLTKDKFVAERNIKLIKKYYESNCDSSIIDDIRQQNNTAEVLDSIDDKEGPIFKQSPFHSYYNEKFTLIHQEMSDCVNTNEFHSKDIALYIKNRLMPFLPMWSGVLYPHLNLNVSRISDAYGESFFNLVKKYVLGKRKNLPMSLFTEKMEAYIKSILKNERLNVPLKSALKDKTKYPEIDKKSNSAPKKDKRKRKKGQTLNLLAEMRNSKVINNDCKVIKASDCTKLKVSQISTLKKVDTSKLFDQIESEHLNDKLQTNQTLSNRTISKKLGSSNSNTTDSNDSTHPDALNNALFLNPEYYMKDIKHVVASITKPDKVLPPHSDFCFLYSTNYKTLRPRTYLDAQVLDCYIFTILQTCNTNIIYVPAAETNTFLDMSQYKHAAKECATKNSKPLNGKILLPYRKGQHFLLLIADIEKKTLTVLDPLHKNSTDGKRIKTKFSKFLNACPDETDFGGLKNIKWTVSDLNIVETEQKPQQRDGYNCGLFVAHYVESIIKNKSFDPDFDADQLRETIAVELLLKSEKMKDLCLYCATYENSFTVMCKSCKRWSHESCIFHTEGIKRTKSEWEKKETKYICGLCQLNDMKGNSEPGK